MSAFKQRRSTPRGPAPLFSAFALFVILCGIVLALTGGGGTRRVDRASLDKVRANLASATQALEATDYGRTRTHLRRATEGLEKLTKN